MANILLSDAKRKQNPQAVNWLDQFRVTTDDIRADVIRQEAVLMNCRILHGGCCYSEDGSVREMCHDLSMDALKKLLSDCNDCVDVRGRKIAHQELMYELADRMHTHAKLMDDLEAEQSEVRFDIR